MVSRKIITLRQATLKDKIRIAKLHKDAWKKTTIPFINNPSFFNKITDIFFIEQWKLYLKESDSITFLAEKDKTLLGFLKLKLRVQAEIQFIYVAYKHRFGKIQKLLCEIAFKEVSMLGFKKIYFSISKTNKHDLLLYQFLPGYVAQKETLNSLFGFEFSEITYEFDVSYFLASLEVI